MATTHSILVAEDEEDVREVIVRVLELSGYDVMGVADGEDAVKMAQDFLPDLILLDVRMPRMTGYEACEFLKGDESTKNIPIVFLTAKGQASEVDLGFALGATDYLVKPFELADLVRVIQGVLGG